MFSKFTVGTLAAMVCLSALSASGATLYLESFPSSVNNTPVNTVGWFSYKGETALDLSAPPVTSASGIVLSSSAGVDTEGNVGSGGPSGLAFAGAAAGASIFLFGTEEAGTVAQPNVGSISFWLRAFTAGGGRVAVRIDANGTAEDATDDSWFATESLFAEADATFVQQTFSFTTAAAAWRDVSFTPGVLLGLAGTARSDPLPAGNITAFGMLFDGSTNGIRMDDYAVKSPDVVAVSGDFDADGDVDGADFVVWQTNFPTSEGATLDTGDADGDGDVDGADFVVWQTNFPTTPGGAALVPEPPAIILLGTSCLWMIARRRRK